MSLTLRIVLITGVLFYFVILINLLKKNLLALKYTLLWILTGIVMGVLVLFPGLLERVIILIGIELPVNGLFAFGIGFIIIILMALTSIVSRQGEKIRILTQQTALLEKEIRESEIREKEIRELERRKPAE